MTGKNMNRLTSLGIDLSASATGLVMLRENGTPHPELLLEWEVKSEKLTGMERAKSVITEVLELIHSERPDKIVLEGYSLNTRNASSIIPLVEIGGLLRFMMYLDGLAWFDPRASEVKKFATGKGNTPKDQVMMWVLKRWGHTSKTNNTADAYVLAAMGLAHANRLPGITMEMRKVIGAMTLRKK